MEGQIWKHYLALCWRLGYRIKKEEDVGKLEGREILIFRFLFVI